MTKYSSHTDWLPLIEVSGPFLTTNVLDNVFPQGLDSIYPETKKHLRLAYEAWRDAQENQDKKMPALHKAWCDIVLTDFLDFQNSDLSDGKGWTALNDTGTASFAPTYAIRNNAGGNEQVPLMFILILPQGTKLTELNRLDEWPASYIEKMTRLCRKHKVRLGIVTNGEAWTLVNAPLDGISGTATWYARLWFQEPKTLRAFSSLLGMRRLFGAPNEGLPALLDESAEHQEEVTNTLGSQVRTAVEVFIQGLDKAVARSNKELLQGVSPAEMYEAGLTVMMRLVFLLCAEERGLLLEDDRYAAYYSISTLRGQLEAVMHQDTEERLERNFDAWPRLLALFRAIYAGIEHPALRLPALGGTIFDPDRYPFLEGRPANTSWRESNPMPLAIDNRTVLLMLNSLQILEQANGALKLSYRSLDVESIGHIYEGLLEYTARKADGVTLGLQGAKGRLPIMTLAELESLAMFDQAKLFAKANEITGRGLTALKNSYNKTLSFDAMHNLTLACNGDSELIDRIVPFAAWLRLDAWGKPIVYADGSYIVAPGQDRRETGTHYTPKSLTLKIVERTLEPLVYEGPAEGTPREKWKLKTPAEILSLKVCDPAMGSGAFLVQSCRYLADKLYESWEQAEAAGKFVTSTGEVHETSDTEGMSKEQDERLNEARQLIAEKCLYGVDINPLAVELAKLSLWLVTISKGRPFAFLDHNLKAGDSLLGIADIEQLRQFSVNPDMENPNYPLWGPQILQRVDEVLELRRQIAKTVIRDITDVRQMEERNREIDSKLKNLNLLADLFTGTLLECTGTAGRAQSSLDSLSTYGIDILSTTEDDSHRWIREARKSLDTDLPDGKPSRHPFHWALDFPEVFEQGGFDAIVGNPPFSGGQHLTGTLGTAYRNYLVKYIAGGARGSADLCAYFYLRAFSLLRPGGIFGLIACNTIAEGDTRQVGLERMVRQNGSIIAAYPNMPWPGTAAVVISLVFFYKHKCNLHAHLQKSPTADGQWHGHLIFNDQLVDVISPFLSQQEEWSPKVLQANANQSFIGSYVLGMGFTMSEEEAQAFIAKDPKNAEVLFPYLNGEDLNSSPTQKASRWVINFFDWPLDRDADGSWQLADDRRRKNYLSSGHVPADYSGRVAADFPDLLAIVEEKVKPERMIKNDALAARKWWLYLRPRPELYHAIGRGAAFAQHPKGWKNNTNTDIDVWGTTLTSKHRFFFQLPKKITIDQTIVTITANKYKWILNSTIHYIWAMQQGCTLGSGPRYTPSDCYETYPFPSYISSDLEQIGYEFDKKRREIMLKKSIGLTSLYNSLHNPNCNEMDILELRKLFSNLDVIVLECYGWNDIRLDHNIHAVDFLVGNDNIRYTISEEARVEVLRRLSALNKQRWEEEQKQ